MKDHNPFAINFEQQKLKAKRRLKSIRNDDSQTFSLVKSFHTQPQKLTKETIQLADVQFALARELGLQSWAKLKAHCHTLMLQKSAMSKKNVALDNELSTLHVRCGHDIQNSLKNSGFSGEYLALIDPLCIGPIPHNETHFVAIRAQYLKDTLLPIMGRNDSTQSIAESEQSNIEILLAERFQRIVFWVEHDMYDQLMLLRGLNLLANEENKIIEIVELNHFPGDQRFIGLGQLPDEAFRLCWQQRKRSCAKLKAQALRSWMAIISGNPIALVDVIENHRLDYLPNMKRVLNRMLQELPHCHSGLSFTQNIALTVLESQQSMLTVKEWFDEYQKWEPLPFLGDVMFFALILPLSRLDTPIITCECSDKPWFEQQFSLTPKGRLCLAKKVSVSQEYWAGSIHITQSNKWVWNHNDIADLKSLA